jgi:hypothetical protein
MATTSSFKKMTNKFINELNKTFFKNKKAHLDKYQIIFNKFGMIFSGVV